LRPKLSRFFNQVAKRVRPPVSRFIGGAAALMPPLPSFFSSRFLPHIPSRFLAKPPKPPRRPSGDWPRKPDSPPR